MSDRTIETTVTFLHPFALANVESPQPAGTYRVVTDEEEIPGISFLAYRRVATMLHVPAVGVSSGVEQVFVVDPVELEAAIEADAGPMPKAPAI